MIIDGQGRVRYARVAGEPALQDEGGVALRRRRSGAMEIRYTPNSIKPMAMLRVVELLGQCERVVLVPGFSDRDAPLISRRTAAIERLTRMASEAQSTRSCDFRSQRHALGTAVAHAAFAPIYRAWRASGGRALGNLLEAVREASAGRYLEVVPREGATKLMLAAVGNGYSLYGNGWKSVAVGGLFEDMPDFEYACWAAQAYREAFRTREPIFEDVAATVRLCRAGPLRLEYRRLILPIGSSDDPTLLLGATLQQNVTRLPVRAGDEVGDVLQ
jgi:hypothetical protein